MWGHQHLLVKSPLSLVKVVMDAAPRTSLLLLNRSPVNALNTQLLKEVATAVKQVEQAKGGKGWGLVIAAENSATSSTFCAGLDLSEMYQPKPEKLTEFWESVQNFWLTIYGSKLATVCAVNGHSPAGGCLLTAACDYRLGASDQPKAKIGLNEAKFGLVAPSWFAVTLQAAVGTRQAERMLQLGELINFEDGKKFGLFDELVPRVDLVNTAMKRAGDWAANGPEEARFLSKIIFRKQFLDELQQNYQKDTEIFRKRVMDPVMQEQLGKYLASLKK